jgi:hypothetical protein
MGRSLEKRIRKLEQAIGGYACDKPGHDQFFVFWVGEEKKAEVEALLKSIDECETCQSKQRMVVRFGNYTSPDYSPVADTPFNFVFGEEEPLNVRFNEWQKPEPQGEEIAIPQWLKDLENLEDK